MLISPQEVKLGFRIYDINTLRGPGNKNNYKLFNVIFLNGCIQAIDIEVNLICALGCNRGS